MTKFEKSDDPKDFFTEHSPGRLKLGSLIKAAASISHKHGVIGLSLEAKIPSQQGETTTQFQCRLTAEQARWLGELLSDLGKELQMGLH